MADTPQRASSGRMWAVRALVVVGAIFGVVAILAGYLRWQVFDEATFRGTAEELIADDQVREQVAESLVDQLYSDVDVTAALQQRLPENLQSLAAPIAGASRALADRAAVRLLERPRIQQLWVDSAGLTQRQIERALDDKLTFFQTDQGYVVLNLRPLVDALGQEVAVVANLESRLPPDAGHIRITQADNLETAQDLTRIFKSIAPFIWIVPLLFFALAIWLARGRRRQAVRMVAIAFVVTGLLVLVARRIGGNYIVDDLVVSETVKPAAANAWDIITSLLADGGWTVLAIGVVALLGTWVAGPTTSGAAVRRRIAPYIVRPEFAFGGLAVVLLLLVWWGPTAQTRRWFFVLVLTILAAVGVEALRRVIAREEPDAVAAAQSEEPVTVPTPPPAERKP
jgi:hypothetical protein